jgi:hypothetical protein
MHTFRSNFKLINHYLKFPSVINSNLFVERKFKPSLLLQGKEFDLSYRETVQEATEELPYELKSWESEDCEHIETVVDKTNRHGIPRSPLIDPSGFKSLIKREEQKSERDDKNFG